MAVTLNNSQLSAGLYSAFWNRAPDATGQNFWVGQLNSGVSALAVATEFYNAPEGLAAYPNWIRNDPAALVTQVYTSVFQRAPDSSGLAFYQAQLAAGTSFPQVVINMMLNALNADNTDGQQFKNEIQVGIYVSEVLRTDDPFITGQALEGVTADPASVTAREAQLAQMAAQTFTLTTGVDAPGFGAFAFTSPNGNSNTMGILGTGQTFNAYDQIQATGTNNTVTLVDVTGGTALAAAQVSGVQTLNVRSQAGVGNTNTASFDVSGWTGLTAANVTQSAGADFLKAAATTAVTVNNTGAVTVAGGSTQAVTTSAGDVTLTGAAGAVTLTDTAQGAYDILVENGTNVNVTSTQATTSTISSAATDYSITVGSATAAYQPTGVITVVANEGPAAAGAFQGGTITTYGGTAVNVTVNGTQPAAANGTSPSTTTQSNVNVNGGTATTTATVNQTAATAGATGAAAVTGVNAANTVTFIDVTTTTATIDVVVGGLTFTINKNTTATAAQIASAFANLANGAINGGVTTTIGTFKGAVDGWTSAAASGANVTFTSTTQTTGQTLTATSNGSALAQSAQTAGKTAVTAVAAAGAIANGDVTVADLYTGSGSTTAGTIATVTANNYKTLTVNDNALTTLNATGGGNITINNGSSLTTKTTTLTLNLNKVGTSGNDAVVDDANIYTTVNVTTSGADSYTDISGLGGMTTLSVAGTNVMNSTNGVAAALKNVTVTGSAAITGDFSAMATAGSINASGTSGNNTVTVDASKVTFTGGTGNDTVTTYGTTVSKAITLGTGNDKVTLADNTAYAYVTADIGGGLGTDTLGMLTADAVANVPSSQFISHLSGFETLELHGTDTSGGNVSIDLGLLALASNSSTINGSVIVDADAGSVNNGTLSLLNFANNGTLTIDGAQHGTVALSNVAAWTGTGTANLTLLDTTVGATGTNIAGGTVSVSGVSTVNVSTSQVATAANADTLTISDVAYTGSTKALTTINVTGNSNLTLTTNSSDSLLANVSASGMTGALTYTAVGAHAQTVTGGAGNDILSAHSSSTIADTLIGGAGNDKLTTNAGLTTMTGGAGTDTFVAAVANTSTSYSTIADFAVGEHLQMKAQGTETFASTKISLANTATFVDYLNAAAAGDGSTNGALSWFQFGGNTYVVEDLTSDATFAATDIVVALTGTIDLSHSALSLAQVGLTSAYTPTLTLFA